MRGARARTASHWLIGLLLCTLLASHAMSATLWTPASTGAPALAVWFDGADASSLTTNPSNTAHVLGWHDKSGNGNDASVSDSRAPSLTTLNGRSAVDFGPYVESSSAGSGMYLASPVSVQGVFMVYGSQSTGGFLLGSVSGIDWHRGLPGGGRASSDALFDNRFANSNLFTGDAESRLNGNVVDPITNSLSGSWDLISVRTSSGNAVPFDTLSFDRVYRAGGQMIAEVVAVSGHASTADVQKIEGYLAWKWGLQGQLPSNHPYKAVPPTVADGNLIVDGSFESGNTSPNGYAYGPTDQVPWVFGGSGDTAADSGFSGGVAPPPDGIVAAFVQTNGSLQQTFNVPAPGIYALSFQMAQRANLSNPQTLSIQIDGSELLQVSQPNDGAWHAVSVPSIMLTAGNHILRFQGLATTDATDFIDAVAVTPVTVGDGAATFVTFDRTTQGNWKGVYGTEGYRVVDDTQSYPGYASVTGSNNIINYVWAGSTSDPRGLQKVASTTDYIAACDYNNTPFSYAITINDGQTHSFALYALDWDNSNGRAERIDISDTASGVLLSSQDLTSFSPGLWAVWDIAGNVTVTVTWYGGANGVISGLFFGRSSNAVQGRAGAFNAFESATPPGSAVGMIHTKIAGAGFGIDAVALNPGGGTVQTGFAGTLKAELLDASDNSGALDSGSQCRSSWVAISGNAGVTATFGGSEGGRQTISLAEPGAWRDVRIRLSTPATGTPTTVACSTDDFAIRPSAFAGVSVSDADAGTAGTVRSLTNTVATGGVVHQAGQPFTIAAAAVNAANATTTGYVGTPALLLQPCSGTACPSSGLGALSATPTATAGVINTTATYSEAGSISLQLTDVTFASVDASDGSSTAELTIASPVIDVGRFVPDHFDVTSLAAPVLRTFDTSSCGARSFTYLGQPFGYATPAQATVTARNASGATTLLYAGALWKLSGTSLSQSYSPTPASPALDTSAITAPGLTSNGNGTGLLVGAASDKLNFIRPGNAPIAPFNASIALSWSATDSSEAAVSGNGSITTATPLVFSAITFDAGSQMRYGTLRLQPAYGSELVNLPVLLEAQYWDGQRMATNAADQCTSVPVNAVTMGNYQRNLAACKTALGSGSTTLASGRGYLKLARPGSGNAGSVDLALQLGASAAGQSCSTVGGAASATSAAALPWLQGKWNGATAFDQNPTTRASFGQYRSPLIYLRESF